MAVNRTSSSCSAESHRTAPDQHDEASYVDTGGHAEAHPLERFEACGKYKGETGQQADCSEPKHDLEPFVIAE